TGASRRVPIVRLPLDLLRQSAGEVTGFSSIEGLEREQELGALGVTDAPWLIPKRPDGIPTLSLRDLADDHVPAAALEGHIAVVAVGTGSAGVAPQELASSALPPAKSAAAALGGLMDGGRRRETPSIVAIAFVLLAGGFMWFARR